MATQTMILHLDGDPLGGMVVVDVEVEGHTHPTLGMALEAAGLDPCEDVRSVELYEPIARAA